jgi:hypothetical protein
MLVFTDFLCVLYSLVKVLFVLLKTRAPKAEDVMSM